MSKFSVPAHSHSSAQLWGVLFVLISATLFSAKSVFVKLAYQYAVDSVVVLTLRMAFALPFFIAMLWWSEEPSQKPSSADYAALIAAGVFGYYGASIFDFWGMEYISASLERLILFMYPTLTVFLSAIFFKTAISQRTWWAIVLSYGGMLLVFTGYHHEPQKNIVLGSSLVFLGALAYAGYLIASAQLIPRFGAARFTALALSVASLCCFIQFLLTHSLSELRTLATEVWVLCAILGFFCTFLPATLLTQGIRRIGAPQSALVSAISPVITLALGAWLLNEFLTQQQWLGALCILVGVGFISYPSSRHERK
ncbi:DMT family transporter [Agitococcus lubricus]|uniref:EamA domain-containing membrane protein RarD n=1 Tax=Agitococcus lubricus TaxID=1077255 RepID=A0A2T5J152_9GAMM|nr:DMT family transporter [Agitococcus lubricus]PTQ90064.1 EamA domain-containing membrane protein RarD [Agitococcus lubricus]